jgi:hypothetical protein
MGSQILKINSGVLLIQITGMMFMALTYLAEFVSGDGEVA